MVDREFLHMVSETDVNKIDLTEFRTADDDYEEDDDYYPDECCQECGNDEFERYVYSSVTTNHSANLDMGRAGTEDVDWDTNEITLWRCSSCDAIANDWQQERLDDLHDRRG